MSFFDTGNDSRILLLEKAVSEALKLAGRKIPGLRRDVLEAPLKEIESLVRQIRWCYLPKEELVNSEQIKLLEEKAEELKKIIEEVKLAEKDEKTYKFLRFLTRLAKTMRERLQLEDDPVSAVDVRFVKVISVQKHPKAERLYITWVTDGTEKFEIVTNDPSVKAGEVLLLAFLPPKEFMGVVSEGMFLGGEGIKRGSESDVGTRPSLSEAEAKKLKGEVLHFIRR